MLKKKFFSIMALLGIIALMSSPLNAAEVKKGAIPAEHLSKSYKMLPWNVAVWDLPEAVKHLKAKDEILWVDTRPESFYKKGSVRGAVIMPYNKSGETGNDLTPESLEAKIKSAGMAKDSIKIAFFCQGPKCHRSYNAAYIAVTEWGYKPENIVWFRDGYPILFKEVKKNPKLKRKAKRYISDAGLSQL
jgi:Rhodanese-like domain